MPAASFTAGFVNHSPIPAGATTEVPTARATPRSAHVGRAISLTMRRNHEVSPTPRVGMLPTIASADADAELSAEFAALVLSFREHAPPASAAPELGWSLPPEWAEAELEAHYWREAHASGIFELEMVSGHVALSGQPPAHE